MNIVRPLLRLVVCDYAICCPEAVALHSIDDAKIIDKELLTLFARVVIYKEI